RTIRRRRADVNYLKQQLSGRLQSLTGTKKMALQRLAGQLHALSPLQVLKRGYSITRRHPAAELITDAARLQPGDLLNITFSKGRAECKVTDVSRNT
ncbi:MAG: exodeoxyribonuclease VII large subunit, partial [Deltaproteobacteria bacterium]|nr:exodeoxyribonuclease VII large subunit [Deltaproteobacteria bacterium]